MSATIAATGEQSQALAGKVKKLLAVVMLAMLAACTAIPRGGDGPDAS